MHYRGNALSKDGNDTIVRKKARRVIGQREKLSDGDCPGGTEAGRTLTGRHMALVIDNRATVNGPGVHALIVGVSNYQALPDHDDPPQERPGPSTRLTSGALSAFAFYEAVTTLKLRLR